MQFFLKDEEHIFQKTGFLFLLICYIRSKSYKQMYLALWTYITSKKKDFRI